MKDMIQTLIETAKNEPYKFTANVVFVVAAWVFLYATITVFN